MTLQDILSWATVLSSGVTALFTVVLAICTWFLFAATRRMAEAMREPHVVAAFEPSRVSFMHLDFLVENTGTGPAYDVQLVFDPPLKRLRDNDEIDLPFNPISVLRPGQSLRNYIGEGHKFLKLSYKISISWKNAPTAKSRMTNNHDLNFAHYENFMRLGGEDPSVKIAKEIEKIQKSMDRLGKRSNKFKVDIYTNGDREREEAELEQHWNSQNPVAVEDPLPAAPPKKKRPTPRRS